MTQPKVIPSVGFHRGLVDLDMNVPQSPDVGVALDCGVINKVVELRETEVATQHDFPSIPLQHQAGTGESLCARRERESLEYV